MTTQNMRREDGEGKVLSRRSFLTGAAKVAAVAAVATVPAIAAKAAEPMTLADLSPEELRFIAIFRSLDRGQQDEVLAMLDEVDRNGMVAKAEPERGVYTHVDGTKWLVRQDMPNEALCVIKSQGIAMVALESAPVG